jgi:hypothetical protein
MAKLTITNEEVEQAAKAIKYENMTVYKTIKNGLDKYTVYDSNGELRGTFDSKVDAICFQNFFAIYHDAKGASTGLAVYVHWKCLQVSIVNFHRELAKHFRKQDNQEDGSGGQENGQSGTQIEVKP